MIAHAGGCHCGAVRFEVIAPADLVAYECNCSICNMGGFQHLIVKSENFSLLQGEEELACYQFNSGVAKHFFCSHCGVKSFYVPRSNPNGYSVNARCLQPDAIESLTLHPFDGENWEANAGKLHGLTE